MGTHNGVPVLVSDLGVVAFGPEIRRGVADWNGEGETVGGIVVMRFGQNALNVINEPQGENRRRPTLASARRGNRFGLRPFRVDPQFH